MLPHRSLVATAVGVRAVLVRAVCTYVCTYVLVLVLYSIHVISLFVYQLHTIYVRNLLYV